MPRAPSPEPSPAPSRQVSICSPDVTDWGLPHPPKDSSESPTLTLLICGDIDIDSASALVDYTLRGASFDKCLIDVIVAVGPFVREGDLDQYMLSSPRHQQQTSYNHSHGTKNVVPEYMLPLQRPYEVSCAMEGLVTSSVAQLENIVCRVVYCPGLSDPVTILRDPCKRLTSNSRNIHKQSLPLVPGLAMAGLMYLDGVEEMIRELEHEVMAPTTNRLLGNDDTDDDEDESLSDKSNQSNTFEQISNQLQALKITDDYETTLDQLIALASIPSDTVLDTECTTNVLVTHYVECQRSKDKDDDESYRMEHSSCSAWPPGHTDYLESHKASVCLEIASGGPQSEPAYDLSSGLLRPGSLRKRGAFSIVTLEIASGALQWSVKTVEHYSIPDHQ